MAIKINNTTVIDDSRNVIGVALTATSIYANGTVGTAGSVLTSTGSGIQWASIPAGGAGEFNTGITNVSQLTPLSYETTVFTFPSTAGKKYIIESINVSNVYDADINIIAALNYNANGNKVHFAYNIPIVADSSVELLRQPHIANPSDYITMWSNDINYFGRNDAAEVYMTYTEVDDTDYFGVGVSGNNLTTSLAGIFTSTTNPSVVQSIHLVNKTDNGDYPVSVTVTNGATTSYLVKELIIPRYSTVEICDRPKRIEPDGIVRVSVGVTSTIDVSISGKKITG